MLPEKTIFNTSDLIDYYKSNSQYPDVDKMLVFLAPHKADKIMFFPYAGEFGVGVAKYMVKFHYINAKHKIACIPRGYECYFPDAKEFVYDYPGPKWDTFNGKDWNLDTSISVPRTFKYFEWHKDTNKVAREDFLKFATEKYNGVLVDKISPRDIYDPISKMPLRKIAKIPFAKTSKYNIKVDVVFANRMKSVANENDTRAFGKWPEVVAYLKSKGLTVGGIGKKGFSYENLGVINNFDYDNPNEAGLEMLHAAKYYIGTDTGVTHLAMNFPHLRSILFRMRDVSADWISLYASPTTRIAHEMSKNLRTFNNHTTLFKHIDQFFA